MQKTSLMVIGIFLMSGLLTGCPDNGNSDPPESDTDPDSDVTPETDTEEDTDPDGDEDIDTCCDADDETDAEGDVSIVVGEVADISLRLFADRAVLSWSDPDDSGLAGVVVSSDSFEDIQIGPGVETATLDDLTVGETYEVTLQTQDTEGDLSEGADIEIRFHVYEFVRSHELKEEFLGGVYAPTGLAVDSDGRMYISNDGGGDADCISRLDIDGNLDHNVLAEDVAGLAIGVFPPDGSERLYIVFGKGNTIRAATTDGAKIEDISRIDGEDLNSPSGIAAFSDGQLFAIESGDDQRARVFLFSAGEGDQFHFELGEGTYHGIAADESGIIYALDSYKSRIKVHDFAGVRQDTFEGFSFRHAPGGGLGVTNQGILLIADRDNHQIVALDSEGTEVHSWGEEGSDEGTQFARPLRIAVSPDGLVYVLDYDNKRIQIFRP